MKTRDRGAAHALATAVDSPTTSTTWSSSPAWAKVRRAQGRVSTRPLSGSTTSGSWWGQPGCSSNEPRWWSTLNSRLAAVGADLQERPEPAAPGAQPRLVQRHALVVGHEALGRTSHRPPAAPHGH